MNKNLFGTDGIRGKVGTGLLTQKKLTQVGYGIGKWIVQRYGPQARLMIACDTRISCNFVKSSLKTGLFLHPVILYDGGILPSPAALHIMHIKKNINCALIISASHNSYEDNGIKIVDANIGKLLPNDELVLSNIISEELNFKNYTKSGIEFSEPSFHSNYIEKIISHFNPQFLKGKHIILDCAHGATYKVAPLIFKALGARISALACRPNGYNINKKCGSTFPEKIQHAVVAQNADAGFAFDGDGDRAIAINKNGDIKDGDDLLGILTTHPDFKQIPGIVGTVMSNKGLELFLNQSSKQLFRTNVGDKFVAQYLEKHGLILGGEPSGHIILHNYLASGDGIFTALKCLETMHLTDNWQIKTFTKLPQIIINIPVRAQKKLNDYYLAQLIEETENKLDDGRIVVRYSGTENKLRIMVEHHDEGYAHSICSGLAQILLKEVS